MTENQIAAMQDERRLTIEDAIRNAVRLAQDNRTVYFVQFDPQKVCVRESPSVPNRHVAAVIGADGNVERAGHPMRCMDCGASQFENKACKA